MWPSLSESERAMLRSQHGPLASAAMTGRRGFALECVAAQVCREAGARVATNVFARHLDLGEFNGLDGRRLEVIADGLPLWRGAHLATDTTLVSPLHSDGTAIRQAAAHDGAAPEAARRRNQCTQSSPVMEAERVWWSLQRRWEDGGHPRQPGS